MNEIVLSADYMQYSLQNIGDEIIPDHLKKDLADWNRRYQPIVQMTMPQRLEESSVIAALDDEGIALSARLEREINRPVAYYSEGLLRRLPPS